MMYATEKSAYDVVIVGAGFAGLYLLHRLRENGFSAVALEAGDDVGGTWYWNRYPGARCDLPSVEYQLGHPEFLQKEWTWTERYAAQPEIEKYLQFVADRLDLRRDIRLNERVVSARFEQADSRWVLKTAAGLQVSGRFCVMATGAISASHMPDLPGMDGFKGEIHHSARWPKRGVDFRGKQVAVIGTGSSGVQLIPEIAAHAAQLFVMQRTPAFVFPALNRRLDHEEVGRDKVEFPAQRAFARQHPSGTVMSINPRASHEMNEAEREMEFESRWQLGSGFSFLGSTVDLLVDETANSHAAEFVRRKIKEIVKEPDLAEKLTPRGFPIGAKRICLGTGYYETFLRSNVSLIDVSKEPIERLTPTGIVCGGKEYDIDILVFATGFDSLTGAVSRIEIIGREKTLAQAWADGPTTYLGLAVAGFPNLFLIAGPGSPSVIGNVVVAIEQHVDWIVDCMTAMRRQNQATIEATQPAQDKWVAHVNEVASKTLYHKANSWYLGANIPGKPRVFLPYVGGAHVYRAKCDAVAREGYAGFAFRPSPSSDRD